MAWKLLNKLDEVYPQLAERAREMNNRDGFRMKYEIVENQQKEKEHHWKRKVQRTV